MEKKNIGKNFFKGFTPLYGDNNESLILYKDDVLTKIIYPEFLQDNREAIIERLEILDHEGLSIPTHMLYDKKGFLGYLAKYISQAISLSEYLKGDIPFEERRKIAIQISLIFDYFLKMNFSYNDIHGGNFLIKDGKPIVIDLDGGVFHGFVNDGLDFNASIRTQTKLLSSYLLSIIYKVDRYELIRILERANTLKRLYYRIIVSFVVQRYYTIIYFIT